MKLSIVIPTLNEAGYLPAALAAVRRRAALGPPHELIVADCGSADGTAELAERLGVSVVRDAPPPDSRAAALNRGAAAATGDVLLFLDADTLVPCAYDRSIRGALRDPQVVGGAFENALDGPGWGLRLIEAVNRVRYRIWPRYYGDQGVFVRAAVFRRAGGYPQRRILEAPDLCRTLARYGRLALIHKPMRTSPRRLLEGGLRRVMGLYVRIWWRDLLGLPTEPFGPAYQENNRHRGENAAAIGSVPPPAQAQ
jgi:glycosyltransferase involved in cell wall biosynthesis